MTLPAGTEALECCVVLPTFRPAERNAAVAAATVSFTTDGTVTVAGPLLRTRFTADPTATLVPAAGFSLMTLPAGTSVLACCVVVPTTKPTAFNALVAAASVLLTTFGTATGAGPLLSTRFTAEPDGSLVPAAGFWLMTLPDGTVLLACVAVEPTTKPAAVIAVVASAKVSLTTFGTVTEVTVPTKTPFLNW